MFKLKRILCVALIACFMCGFGVYSMDSNVVAFAEYAPQTPVAPPEKPTGEPTINVAKKGPRPYNQTIDMFWEYLDGYMFRCEPGTKVVAEAEGRTSMPAYIFESIRDSGTILEVQWYGGETFIIDEIPEYDEKIPSFYFDEIIEMLDDSKKAES